MGGGWVGGGSEGGGTRGSQRWKDNVDSLMGINTQKGRDKVTDMEEG